MYWFIRISHEYNMNFLVIVHAISGNMQDAFGRMFLEFFLMSTGRQMNAKRLADDARQHCHIQLKNRPSINRKLL